MRGRFFIDLPVPPTFSHEVGKVDMSLHFTDWGRAYTKTKMFSSRALQILSEADKLGQEETMSVLMMYAAISSCSKNGELHASDKQLSKFISKNSVELCRIITEAIGPYIFIKAPKIEDPTESIQ